MLYQGKAILLSQLGSGVLELSFDLEGESVNKFNKFTLDELKDAIEVIEKTAGATGLIITSKKDAFVVGADMVGFMPLFAAGEEVIQNYTSGVNKIFNRLEDLSIPTVAAINGYALGGGLEVCLACDYRVASESARIGLPETKLGIYPGWGGTVRLPRIAGVDVAVEWIASGKEHSAAEALKARVIDAVVADDQLRESALKMAHRAIEGKLDVNKRKEQKRSPLKMNDIESLMAFESSKAFVKAQAGRHYPAPVKAVQVMQDAAKLGRDEALALEMVTFVQLALSSTAQALVGLFLSDQLMSKKAKAFEQKADKKVAKAAVLGAGIMGGGIAYQSVFKGVPVIMKDIAQEGIGIGLKEASKLLSKRVERGRLTPEKMAEALTRITPALSYDGFSSVDLVVEAVVENPKVKSLVLADVEKAVSNDTIICSNTSTISITHLASSLARPENFCGMHFFNPVHKMPLVEVIRGEQSSEMAIARTVAYANALGKKAIVVNDCPGFLVNRVLFPYLAGFSMLLRDGADFQHIDKVMEKWGWPMGPAYLIDVVGIDTAVHAEGVMAEGFPERMSKKFKAVSDVMFEEKRYGQKNGKGFYNYELDKKGKVQKTVADEVYPLIKSCCSELKAFSDEEIIARMIAPMATELARCVEEGIVGSIAEADMALVYGLGFPPFRGGIFRWIDRIGIKAFLEMLKPFESLGPLYEPTEGMLDIAQSQSNYYGQS